MCSKYLLKFLLLLYGDFEVRLFNCPFGVLSTFSLVGPKWHRSSSSLLLHLTPATLLCFKKKNQKGYPRDSQAFPFPLRIRIMLYSSHQSPLSSLFVPHESVTEDRLMVLFFSFLFSHGHCPVGFHHFLTFSTVRVPSLSWHIQSINTVTQHSDCSATQV